MIDSPVIPPWQHWHSTDRSTSVQISRRSTPPVGGRSCLCDKETAREWRKATCTQITCEREWMWQLWHTHDRGNAAKCLSDSPLATAGLCGRGRKEAGGGAVIHRPWQTCLAVMYSLCMSVLSVCPSASRGHVVGVSGWPSMTGVFLPAHILLSLPLCSVWCFSYLNSVHSDLQSCWALKVSFSPQILISVKQKIYRHMTWKPLRISHITWLSVAQTHTLAHCFLWAPAPHPCLHSQSRQWWCWNCHPLSADEDSPCQRWTAGPSEPDFSLMDSKKELLLPPYY